MGGGVELAAYGEAGQRVLAAYGDASVSEVADDWEDRWRAFHQPVRVGPLWVAPPWFEAPDELLAVVVDPGRAFGTGAHPSTRLCLELLAEQQRGSLLDLGCGSGVLAIAACKLGFAPVVAVDLDGVAVEVAAANARANGVGIEARVLDVRDGVLPAADVTVANVSLEVVESLAGAVRGGRLITAGYLVSDRPRLDGFERLDRHEFDGWAADLFAPA